VSTPATVGVNPRVSANTDDALPASQTGGFDGARAFQDVAKLVSFGPHPSGSDGIHQAQQYIETELKSRLRV
jgi:hypothetical protein